MISTQNILTACDISFFYFRGWEVGGREGWWIAGDFRQFVGQGFISEIIKQGKRGIQ